MLTKIHDVSPFQASSGVVHNMHSSKQEKETL